MTIYDIAKCAGVSASTVSRVLNNKPGVNRETRARIEKLLVENHFAPNASAQGLVSQSSRIIGIMMSDIRTIHHAESAYYVEQALQKAGYSCLIVNCGFTDESREAGLRLLASRRAVPPSSRRKSRKPLRFFWETGRSFRKTASLTCPMSTVCWPMKSTGSQPV